MHKMRCNELMIIKAPFIIVIIVMVLTGLLLDIESSDAGIFLENTTNCPTCTDGNSKYDPATRSCGSGSETVYTSLASFNINLTRSDSNYIRSGTYTRNTADYNIGSLSIDGKDGTASNHTIVRAYPGEERQVIIGTDSAKLQYNPTPGDTGFTGSSHYYPNPAISISGSYVDVIGFKTYGQVVIRGHDNSVQDCDLGGGGPNTNQGQVVFLTSCYNILVENNLIHNSCWGESDANGAALMGYNFSAVIKNNRFFDNWGSDIRLKDTGGQTGRSIVIENNFFQPSSLRSNAGVQGIAQDGQVDYIYIHHNIFYKKTVGIAWDGSALKKTVAYQNTFINCGTDISTWLNPVINVFNNLYYHSNSSANYYDIQANPLSNLNSDYNLYYSTNNDTKWRNLYRTQATTLSSWISYSGKDQRSVNKNPQFINASGSTPEDFKRTNFIENFTGSTYGVHAGAYETGNEIIGASIQSGQTQPPPKQPPGIPQNIRVIP